MLAPLSGRREGRTILSMKNEGPLIATIFTIGHSTRPLPEFAEMLQANGIEILVDVRTIPRSRQNPQYNSDALAAALREHHIVYEHLPGLGGLRHPRKDSVNAGWENASFRGFADYMQSEEFALNLDRLIETARKGPTAVMCAEAVPWRCHRSLISDALLVRGFTVMDIMSKRSVKEHRLTPWAKVEGERITYPAAEPGRARKREGGAV
jgi:uncharacterized protein (DUF488 family)